MVGGEALLELCRGEACGDMPPVLLVGPRAAETARAVQAAREAAGCGVGVRDQAPVLAGDRALRCTNVADLSGGGVRAETLFADMDGSQEHTWWVLHAPGWTPIARRLRGRCLTVACGGGGEPGGPARPPADDGCPWPRWLESALSSGAPYPRVVGWAAGRMQEVDGVAPAVAARLAADAESTLQRLSRAVAVSAVLRRMTLGAGGGAEPEPGAGRRGGAKRPGRRPPAAGPGQSDGQSLDQELSGERGLSGLLAPGSGWASTLARHHRLEGERPSQNGG